MHDVARPVSNRPTQSKPKRRRKGIVIAIALLVAICVFVFGIKFLQIGKMMGMPQTMPPSPLVDAKLDELVALANKLDQKLSLVQQPHMPRFDCVLDVIAKLVSVVAKDLDAIVLPRIVRGGDDDAGGKIARSRQVSNARGRDDPSFDRLHSLRRQAARQHLGNPFTRFPRVLPNDNLHARMLRRQPNAERAPDNFDCPAVKRILAGNATNAVSPEKLALLRRRTAG